MHKNSFFSKHRTYLTARNDFLPVDKVDLLTLVDRVNQLHYDFKLLESNYIIPREKHIKTMLDHFNKKNPILRNNHLLIENFYEPDINSDSDSESAAKLETTSERITQSNEKWLDSLILDPAAVNLDHLMNLPIFRCMDDNLPVMKNGHDRSSDGVARIITIRERSSLKIIGAAHFEISFRDKKMFILNLAVEKNKRRMGCGSAILQAALFVGMLYGCEIALLEATSSGIPLYIKHGFYYLNEQTDNGKYERIVDVDILQKEYNLPQLTLSIPESFSKLKQFMGLVDFDRMTYKAWQSFEQLLILNAGKITQAELDVLLQGVQMEEDKLKELVEKRVDVITKWNPKRKQSGNSEQDIKRIKIDGDDDLSTYQTPEGFTLRSLF